MTGSSVEQLSPRRVMVVTAGLSEPSSSRMLADRITDAVVEVGAAAGLSVEVEVVELREHARAMADHLVTGFATDDLAGVLSRVGHVDGLVAVTPVFSASFSGLFKTFFDLVDVDALTGRPVLLAATAGTPRHSLVLEHALRPLFSYLRATTVPTGVFAATSDFGGAAGHDLGDRVERAARELVALMHGSVPVLAEGDERRASRRAPLPGPDEEFGEVIPFDQLLHR